MLTKILHIILATWIFTSSCGMVVNQHFCMNELKGFALFVKPESCHSKMNLPVCPNHQKSTTKNCCDNKSNYLKLDQDQQYVGFDYQVFKDFFIAINFAFSKIILSKNISGKSYLTYKPPIVCKTISPSFLQTFLL